MNGIGAVFALVCWIQIASSAPLKYQVIPVALNNGQQEFVPLTRLRRHTDLCIVNVTQTFDDILKTCIKRKQIKPRTREISLNISLAEEDNVKEFFSKTAKVELPLILDHSGIQSLNLENVVELRGFVVMNNPNLKTINIVKVKTFRDYAINIEGNPQLEELNFPSVEEWKLESGKRIQIKKNTNLKNLNMGTYQFPSEFNPNGLEIIGNRNLKHLTFSLNTGKIMESVNVTIRGNRNLDKDDIEKMKKLKDDTATNWDIQEPGECLFPDPVRNMEELNGCKYVDGDLVFQETIVEGDGNTGSVIGLIKGNLIIKNTKISQLRVFQNTVVNGNLEVEDNPGLCAINQDAFSKHFDVKGSTLLKNPPCPTTTTTTTTTKATTTTTATETTPLTSSSMAIAGDKTSLILLSAIFWLIK